MNTNKILGLFDKYRVVIVKVDGVEKDELVTIASPSDVIGESDNEVLYLGWFDEDGEEYSIKFSEGGLDGAIINDNGNLVMEDTEGDSIEIEFQVIKSIKLGIEDID
jgi:hypothetical protein